MTRAAEPLTLDQRKALRRKPLWRISDFALYMGLSHGQARAMLLRYNAELLGTLLRASDGAANRVWTFFWRSLAKHAPEAFLDDPIETQARLDHHDEQLEVLHTSQRVIASTVGGHTREIEKIKRSRRSA